MKEVYTTETLWWVTFKMKDGEFETYEVIKPTDFDIIKDIMNCITVDTNPDDTYDFNYQNLVDQYGFDIDVDNIQTLVGIDYQKEVPVVEFID